MRKLSVTVAALFLLGSAPAFAQGTPSGTAPGASGASEAPAAGSEMSADGGMAKKEHKKHKAAKKSSKKKAAADAGM